MEDCRMTDNGTLQRACPRPHIAGDDAAPQGD